MALSERLYVSGMPSLAFFDASLWHYESLIGIAVWICVSASLEKSEADNSQPSALDLLISFENDCSHGLERHGWRRKALLHRDGMPLT